MCFQSNKHNDSVATDSNGVPVWPEVGRATLITQARSLNFNTRIKPREVSSPKVYYTRLVLRTMYCSPKSARPFARAMVSFGGLAKKGVADMLGLASKPENVGFSNTNISQHFKRTVTQSKRT